MFNTNESVENTNIYEISEAVIDSHGLRNLTIPELHDHLTSNGISVIESRAFKLKDMGDTGYGVVADRPIRPGHCIPYGLGGKLLRLSEVANNKEVINSEKLISVNKFSISRTAILHCNDTNKDPKKIIQAHVLDKLRDELDGDFCALVYYSDTKKYQMFLTRILSSKKLFEIIEVCLEKQYPGLYELASQNPGNYHKIHKYLESERYDKENQLILLPRESNGENFYSDIAQYFQHAKENSWEYFQNNSFNSPNFYLTYISCQEHLIPILKAKRWIAPGELLCWDYIDQQHREEFNVQLEVWTTRGESLSLLPVLHHHNLHVRTYISEMIDSIEHMPENPQLYYALYLQLHFAHKAMIFALDDREINFLIEKIDMFRAFKSTTEVRSSELERFYVNKLESLVECGYIQRYNKDYISKTLPQLQECQETAINFLLENNREISGITTEKTYNRDEHYVPRAFNKIGHSGKKTNQEKEIIGENKWSEAKSFAKKAVIEYRNNRFDCAIKSWQTALKLAKNSIDICEVSGVRENLSLLHGLYWDNEGSIASLHKNLATAYNKLGMETETLYHLEKCRQYIELGYGKFYKNPKIVEESYVNLVTELELQHKLTGVASQEEARKNSPR